MAGSAFWESGIEKETTLTSGTGATLRTINQTFSDHPWDVAFISGLRLPGICEVLDGLTQIGIDNKNPDGKDGSTLTLKGYRPGPFEISCVTWTRAQDDELQEIEDFVWRRPQKKAKVASVAMEVYHPALERRGIATGALIGITFPRPGPFEGSKVVHFKFIENVPPGPKRQTKSSTPGVTVAKPLQSGIDRSTENDKPIPPSKNGST